MATMAPSAVFRAVFAMSRSSSHLEAGTWGENWHREERTWKSELFQTGVFRLRLFEDRDVGVGVFPQGERILVGRPLPVLISRQGEGSAQLHVHQCAYRIGAHDPAVIENLLKFGNSFRIPVCATMPRRARRPNADRQDNND
jgi:hypothetical protein